MSLKSRNRAECEQKNRVTNPLQLQKQAIWEAMTKHLAVAALFLVVIGVVLAIGIYDKISAPTLWLIGLMVGGVSLYFCVAFVRRWVLFGHFEKIKFTTEQSVALHCRQIAFLCEPVSRFASVILCVILKDENGKNFYYIYPKKVAPLTFERKKIRQQYLDKEIVLICYQNTNIVKHLPLK